MTPDEITAILRHESDDTYTDSDLWRALTGAADLIESQAAELGALRGEFDALIQKHEAHQQSLVDAFELGSEGGYAMGLEKGRMQVAETKAHVAVFLGSPHTTDTIDG